MSVAALGTRLGVAAQTAHNWLVAGGVPRREPAVAARVEVSDVEVRRLSELECWTAAEVAAHVGCSTSRVYARLQRLGVPVGRRGPDAAPGPRTPSSGACTSNAGSASARSPSGSR